MAKKAYVYNGSAWEDLASSTSDLSSYATTVDLDDYQLKSVAGLTLITTATFSAVAAASINDCFSGTYKNYKVMFNETAQSANALIYFRLRNAGSDRATSEYYNATQGLTYGNGAANLTSQQSVGYIGEGWGPGIRNKYSLDVFEPFTAGEQTLVNGTSNGATVAAGSISGYSVRFYYDLANTNDGLTIYPASGTISGTIRVYGYQD